MQELNGPQFEKIKEERFENKILVYPSIKYKINTNVRKPQGTQHQPILPKAQTSAPAQNNNKN